MFLAPYQVEIMVFGYFQTIWRSKSAQIDMGKKCLANNAFFFPLHIYGDHIQTYGGHIQTYEEYIKHMITISEHMGGHIQTYDELCSS